MDGARLRIERVWRYGRFTPVAGYQRAGYAVAAVLVLSAAVHLAVLLVTGGTWVGPVSWRKPVLFGFSFGTTLATLTWFLTFLRLGRLGGWAVVVVLGVGTGGEVLLVTLQQWRGVPSHFNVATPFDTAVFIAMGFLIAAVVAATAVLLLRSLWRVRAPASLAWALRAALLLLLVSNAVGAQMIAGGGSAVGEAGTLKVPHALTVHALQVLPLLALLVGVADRREARRVATVAAAALGYGLLVASTVLQAEAGRSPLEPDVVPVALAVAGLVVLAGAVVDASRAVLGPAATEPGPSGAQQEAPASSSSR